MSNANTSVGFFSGGRKKRDSVSADVNDTLGTVWHEDTLITRPNGSQTALKNLAVGDKIRSLAPRSEYLGKMLNADGTYNPQAIWAVWAAGSPWSTPNPDRFLPEYIPTPARVPNGNEFVLGEAEIAYLSIQGVQNGPYVGTAPTLYFTAWFRPETTPNAPESLLSGSLINSAMPQLAIAADNNNFVYLARNGVYSDWPNSAYLKAGKPNTFRFIRPSSGGIPTPTDGTTAWNVAGNRARITRDAPYPRAGKYISMVLKRVDADSSPLFLANGCLVF